MAGDTKTSRAALWPGVIALAIAAAYLIALLAVEKQSFIISLLAVGIIVVIAAAWFDLLDGVSRAFSDHEDALGGFAILALLAVGAFFHEDHFVLLLVTTVLLYSVATLGLNIQFGYAGVLNFAGASFFGIGLYLGVIGFSAAIIGGLGSIYGAILGGFLFAGLQTVGTVLLPFASAYKDVFAFAVVIAIMAWRPTGLIQEKISERV